jgi:hypothetical protein
MQTFDPSERVSRQMARLNPANVKFDIGAGGGAPDLTPQDVAAAIGMVPDGLGRELLMHVHWPDAAKARRATLVQLLTLAQLGEHNRREQAMQRALCQVAIADSGDKQRATQAYSEAHMSRWPQIVVKAEPITFAEPYGHIRLGVLEELAHPRICPECNGRDLTDRKGAPKTCERCLNTGIVQYGPTWRAMRLGMQRAAFTERWQEPYQWLMGTCRQALIVAEGLLLSSLR